MKIKFKYKRIGVPEIENILIDAWDKSFVPSTERIIFDLSYVDYVDLPQICTILMWIESLLSSGKSIEMIFIDSKKGNSKISRVFDVIRNYGFFSCLSQYNNFIVIPSVCEQVTVVKNLNSQYTALVHLTSFQSRNDLTKFIHNIDPAIPDPALQVAVGDRDLMNRTGIRDVFLKELGMNVFDHAKGVPAFLAVCRKTSDYLEYSGNPMPIRTFAAQRKAKEYIQVVVADFGVGIPGTLSEIFAADESAHSQFASNAELSVIEYAFWKDVTSKPRRAFDELLDQEETCEYLIPPTGLYFVWNLVRSHKAFMYVRTGKSIWGLDCSSGEEVSITQYDKWKSKNSINGKMVDLPGTLIVVYVPLDSHQGLRQKSIDYSRLNKLRIIFKEFINVEYAILDTIRADEKEQAITLLHAIRELSRKLRANEALIVDCEGWGISTKYLYKLLLYAMYMQKESRFIVFADFSPHDELALAIQEIKNVASGKHQLLPIFHYDSKTQSIEIIGASDNSSFFFKDSRNLQLDLFQVDTALRNGRRGLLESALRSHFHEREKVFLPSKSYITGYFELADLLGHPYFARKLAEALAAKLPIDNYVAIIATAGNLNRLASELAVLVKISNADISIVKGEIGRPISDIPDILSCLAKNPGGLLLILADVIVTGQSVLTIQKTFGCRTFIASIVDASGGAINSSENVIGSVSVIKHSFNSYVERPAKWKYEDISLVDTVSHKLIRSGPLQDDTLLDSEKHLKRWISEDRAIRCGHYYYGDVHANYFFHTYIICHNYNDLIMETIRSDIKKILRHGSSVSHICYPEKNQAAENICFSLQTHVGGKVLFLPRLSDPERTIYSTASSNAHDENAKTMIFIDSAATTSQTLQYAMEMASEYEAEKLLLYVVINRISGRWPAAFEHVCNYKGIEVRIKSLVRVHLPAYTTNGCPLCMRRIQIDNACNQTLPQNLRNLLKIASKELMPQSIKELRAGENYSSYDEVATSYQVALRDMIEREAKSVTYTARRKLIEQLTEAQENHRLAAGVVACFALEAEELLVNSRYEQLLGGEFKEALLVTAVQVACSIEQPLVTRAQAIWVVSACNYQKFLDLAAQLVSFRADDLLVTTILTATMTYSNKASSSLCCKGLEKVLLALQSKEGAAISDTVMKALSEAIGYFRFRTSPLAEGGSYTDSYRALTHVLKQPGRSHPDIRKAFDACLRAVLPEDLKNIFPNNYLGESGLFTILTEKIIPSLLKVLSVYNEDMLVDLGYLRGGRSETLISDVRELDELFRNCLLKLDSAQLTESLWRQSRERIRALGERIRINFLSPDKGVLQKMLQRSRSSVKENINVMIEEFRSSATEKELTFKVDLKSTDDTVIIPSEIVQDVLLTILDNAVQYSEPHSNILIQSFDDSKGANINIQSSPKGDSSPEIRIEHGLERAAIILKKYDSELFVDTDLYRTDRIASITISLLTETRMLGHDY